MLFPLPGTLFLQTSAWFPSSPPSGPLTARSFLSNQLEMSPPPALHSPPLLLLCFTLEPLLSSDHPVLVTDWQTSYYGNCVENSIQRSFIAVLVSSGKTTNEKIKEAKGNCPPQEKQKLDRKGHVIIVHTWLNNKNGTQCNVSTGDLT